MKRKYKVHVPLKFLEKSGIVAKKKMKVRVPSKFFKPISSQTNVTKKKKLKVRVPSSVIARAVRKAGAKDSSKKKPRIKLNIKKKKKKKQSESSALSKLKRFVRGKNGAKVHPLGSDVDR